MRQITIDKKIAEEKARQEMDKQRAKILAEQKELIDEFFEIVSTTKHMHQARFLFYHYFKIEAVLLMYFSLARLAKTLNENGFGITEKTLKTELYRTRKRLGRASISELKKTLDLLDWEERHQKIVETFDTEPPFFLDYKKVDKRRLNQRTPKSAKVC